LLWRSCFQFISYVRNHQGLLEDHGKVVLASSCLIYPQDRYPVFDIRETDTLGRAMNKMGATRAHRVWIVNDAVRRVKLRLLLTARTK
jgi:hypothetical protein